MNEQNLTRRLRPVPNPDEGELWNDAELEEDRPPADPVEEPMTDPLGNPETREERVARLRDLVASGSYNPSPRDVARAMIDKGF